MQAKQLDPDFGMDMEDEDGWDDALGYLEACGPGVQHQIARTTSLERTLTSSSLMSNGSEASQFLVDESQKDKVKLCLSPACWMRTNLASHPGIKNVRILKKQVATRTVSVHG